MPAVFRRLQEALFIGILAVATPVLGADFRVENRVYLEGDAEPTAVSTTIFHGGQAYDLSAEPDEITVFDVAHRRVILLDAKRKLRLDLTFEEIENFNHIQQQRILDDGRKRLQPLADPQFEEEFDRATGELTLQNRTMTYRVSTMPPESDSAVHRYIAFADWSARLQPLTNRNAPPPFSRLAVNQALVAHNRLPREVSLTTATWMGPFRQRQVVRAVHAFDRLTAEDRRRIDQIGELMAVCAKISAAEFLHRGDR